MGRPGGVGVAERSVRGSEHTYSCAGPGLASQQGWWTQWLETVQEESRVSGPAFGPVPRSTDRSQDLPPTLPWPSAAGKGQEVVVMQLGLLLQQGPSGKLRSAASMGPGEGGWRCTLLSASVVVEGLRVFPGDPSPTPLEGLGCTLLEVHLSPS